MDAARFIERVKAKKFFDDQLVDVRELAERPPVYQDVANGLHAVVTSALGNLGIDELYSHQAMLPAGGTAHFIVSVESVDGELHLGCLTFTASGSACRGPVLNSVSEPAPTAES